MKKQGRPRQGKELKENKTVCLSAENIKWLKSLDPTTPASQIVDQAITDYRKKLNRRVKR